MFLSTRARAHPWRKVNTIATDEQMTSHTFCIFHYWFIPFLSAGATESSVASCWACRVRDPVPSRGAHSPVAALTAAAVVNQPLHLSSETEIVPEVCQSRRGRGAAAGAARLETLARWARWPPATATSCSFHWWPVLPFFFMSIGASPLRTRHPRSLPVS